MDSHLWTEALYPRRWAARVEVAAAVLRGGVRCLRQGGCARLVSGPLARCVGVLVRQSGRSLSLYILRCAQEAEYVESAH